MSAAPPTNPVRTVPAPAGPPVAAAAVGRRLAELRALQAEYETWRDQLPEALVGSRTAELLEEVCDVDLDAIDVELPRGFGRDWPPPRRGGRWGPSRVR